MKQKLAIARALLHEPKVLFLDEPTSALDPEAARVVRDFISELRKEGRTVFLCTHNLDEADRLADRIGIMHHRLLQVDTPANLRLSLYGRQVSVQIKPSAEPYLGAGQGPELRARRPRRRDGSLLVNLEKPEEQNPALVKALVEAGAQVQYVTEVKHSLEEVYFSLLQGGAVMNRIRAIIEQGAHGSPAEQDDRHDPGHSAGHDPGHLAGHALRRPDRHRRRAVALGL